MLKKHLKSYSYALAGIKEIFLKHLNFAIELCVAILVVMAGILFKLTPTEWAIIILTIALVLAIESLNTAIEFACNAIDRNYNKDIKFAKDIAAGAVLIVSVASVAIGLIIFLPHIFI